MLNAGVLPDGFYAVPFLDHEGPVEIDVAALGKPGMPSVPVQTLAVEWPSTDDVRVEIRADDGDPQLAAAIELVSPSNKDRPQSRQAFASKCAEYLRRGCGLVVIDVVTNRRADLHGDLLAALNVPFEAASPDLTATSYRAASDEGDGRLLIWQNALELGRPLPTLPLWIAADLSVPINLEAVHQAACSDSRIPLVGTSPAA